MRRFVRHPTDIPIIVQPSAYQPERTQESVMSNVSLGGLSCEVDAELVVGCKVDINIPFLASGYRGCGEVVWCRRRGNRYEVGVRFTDSEEAYKSRMIQQVCQIEHYKKWVLEQEGRQLDGNQAAAEWIEKFAADFH